MSARRTSSTITSPAPLQVLGLISVIAGFLGVPVLVLLNASQNLPLTLAVHAVVTVLVIGGCIWKCGSFQAWVNYTRQGAVYNVHSGWIALIGAFFSAVGVYIILDGKPATGPNAMAPREIVYTGSIFVLIGMGIAAMAAQKLRQTEKR